MAVRQSNALHGFVNHKLNEFYTVYVPAVSTWLRCEKKKKITYNKIPPSIHIHIHIGLMSDWSHLLFVTKMRRHFSRFCWLSKSFFCFFVIANSKFIAWNKISTIFFLSKHTETCHIPQQKTKCRFCGGVYIGIIYGAN